MSKPIATAELRREYRADNPARARRKAVEQARHEAYRREAESRGVRITKA